MSKNNVKTRVQGDLNMCLMMANSFFKTVCICDDERWEDGKSWALLFPIVVNLAFAAELYIKALMILNSSEQMFYTGHNLKILFAKLPNKVQEQVRENYKKEEFATLELDELINKYKNVFIEWRYAFSAKKKLSIHSTDFAAFVRCLKKVCSE